VSGRIRSVKPEWLADERLLRAGTDARVLSIALLLMADDYGRGRYIAEVMGPQVFPFEPEQSRVFREAFARLSAMGFVVLYKVRSQTYFAIVNWAKHQKVDKPGKPHVPEHLESLEELSRKSRETLEPDLDQRPTTNDQRPGEGGECEGRPSAPAADAALPLLSEPANDSRPQKPRKVDEAKAALKLALRDSFRASGETAAVITDGNLAKATVRVRDAVKDKLAPDIATAAQQLVVAARKTGGKWPWCLFDAQPYGRRGGQAGKHLRVAPATTGKDFADADDVDVQLERMGLQ
jgi:hypothetical protein